MMKRLVLVCLFAGSSLVAAPSVDALAKLLHSKPDQLIALYQGDFAEINTTAADIWKSSTVGMTEEQKLMVIKEALQAIGSNSATTLVPAQLQAAGMTDAKVWEAAKMIALTIAGCTAGALVVYIAVQAYSDSNSLNHMLGSTFNEVVNISRVVDTAMRTMLREMDPSSMASFRR